MTPRPKVKRPTSDDDYFDRPLVLDGITVFELEDAPPFASPILQPNGDRIIYYPIPERQPWIGFLKPSWIEPEDEEEDDDAATQ